MKRIALLLAGVVFLAAPAKAAGTFDLSWDGCTGPIVKAIAPGSVNTVYATVTGRRTPRHGAGSRTSIGDARPAAIARQDPAR